MHKHYEQVERYVAVSELKLECMPEPPVMLVPVSHWNRATVAAVQLACSLSNDVRVLHITDVEGADQEACHHWQSELTDAAVKSSLQPRVLSITSPYRSLSSPIMQYVIQMEIEAPNRKIAVVIAEVVATHWYQHVMHNYRGFALKFKLFFKGNRRVVILDMPWQLPSS